MVVSCMTMSSKTHQNLMLPPLHVKILQVKALYNFRQLACNQPSTNIIALNLYTLTYHVTRNYHTKWSKSMPFVLRLRWPTSKDKFLFFIAYGYRCIELHEHVSKHSKHSITYYSYQFNLTQLPQDSQYELHHTLFTLQSDFQHQMKLRYNICVMPMNVSTPVQTVTNPKIWVGTRQLCTVSG